jgi:hypothetical protein
MVEKGNNRKSKKTTLPGSLLRKEVNDALFREYSISVSKTR